MARVWFYLWARLWVAAYPVFAALRQLFDCELDFFNRVGNLKDQALEQYLATEDAQAIARISLIAEVANTWLTLAADPRRPE